MRELNLFTNKLQQLAFPRSLTFDLPFFYKLVSSENAQLGSSVSISNKVVVAGSPGAESCKCKLVTGFYLPI